MSDVKDGDLIDAPVAPAHQAEIIKDRRRPGRIQNVSPALIPLLRNPTGAVAGDLFPIDKFSNRSPMGCLSLSGRCLAQYERNGTIRSHLP